MPATKPKTPAKTPKKPAPKPKAKAAAKPRVPAAERVVKSQPGKGPKVDQRKRNGGKRTPPGGKPLWKPTPEMRTVRSTRPGVPDSIRMETEEETWQRYRLLVAHYVAGGCPLDMIGKLFTPSFSVEILKREFARELEVSEWAVHMEVEGRMMRRIRAGDGGMIRYYQSKRRPERYGPDAFSLSLSGKVGFETEEFDDGL